MSATPKWLVPAAFLFGIALLVAILALVVEIPQPTQFQFIVFRTVLAIGVAAVSMVLTGSLTIHMQLFKRSLIVGSGALGVFVLVYLISPAIPGVPKPADAHGHPRVSDANEAERTVVDLQDDISDLIPHKDRVQFSDYDRRNLKDAPSLAERISKLSDTTLRLRYRYLKYEWAAFAYEMAAVAAMLDDRPRVEEYATKSIKNANTALSMLDNAGRTDEESTILLDWVIKDEGKDRVLYLKAEAACMLGTIRNNAALESQALEMWNQISSTYRADFPAAGTLQLNGCVPMEKSN